MDLDLIFSDHIFDSEKLFGPRNSGLLSNSETTEIFFPDDKIPLYLDKRSASLKLIQKIRNESHRFAIKKHRKKRIKNTLKTSLEDIPGIGPKTVQVLISHFGSTKKVFSAKREDIIKLVGEAKTRLIFK